MSEEEKALIKKNKVIDITLRQDHIANTQIIKMLLLGTFFTKLKQYYSFINLGAGECGKSTILKQMK